MFVPIIPAFRKLGEENLEFKASLSYTGRPSLKTKQNKNPRVRE
jgi:hypothetical protein